MSHPGTVAVIDVGSNSIRLLVARALSPLAFEVIDEERFDARLGEGQEGGNLTPGGIDRGLRALAIMAQVAASFSPTVTIAVGTEAAARARLMPTPSRQPKTGPHETRRDAPDTRPASRASQA